MITDQGGKGLEGLESCHMPCQTSELPPEDLWKSGTEVRKSLTRKFLCKTDHMDDGLGGSGKDETEGSAMWRLKQTR